VAISLILVLLLAGGGWLGWQVVRTRAELDREKEAAGVLALDNRVLNDRREKLLAREQIVARAARLGIYPPGPAQIRKLGAR